VQHRSQVAIVNNRSEQTCPTCGPVEMRDWMEGPDRFNGRKDLYWLVRCPICSLVRLKNPPLPSEMDHHYGPNYDRFIGKAGDTSPERWRARERAISQYKTGGTLLDLGCSYGSFLESVKKPEWRLFGIEMSANAAREAQIRSGGRVCVGDILEANFASHSFDVITCFDVLEHVYEPRSVMARVREWLKPDGIFYMLVPNIDSAEARIFRSYWYGLELPRHLTHFSPTSLRLMAQAAGLSERFLSTGRNSALEHSITYLVDDLLRGVGTTRMPPSMAPDPGIPWRIVRKALRASILPIVRGAISLAGDGESIHAVFGKDGSATNQDGAITIDSALAEPDRKN
jgi:SAM-dependent methyltransferase